MKEISNEAFLSFLYAERDRIFSNYSYAGWNVWVIVAALVGIIWLLIDLLSYGGFDTVVLIQLFVGNLFIGYLILHMLSLKLLKKNPPIKNRYNLFSSIKLANVYLNIFTFIILDIIFIKYRLLSSIPVPVVLFFILALFNIASLIISYWLRKKGEIVPIDNSVKIDKPVSILIVSLLILFAFYLIATLSFPYFYRFQSYIPEIKLSLCITVIYFLIRMLILICDKSSLLTQMDSIIDEYIYNDLSQSEALKKITICQYRLSAGQIMERELDEFLTLKAILDKYLKNIVSVKENFDNDCPLNINMRKEFLLNTLDELKKDSDKRDTFLIAWKELINKISKISTKVSSSEEAKVITNVFELMNQGEATLKEINSIQQEIIAKICMLLQQDYCVRYDCYCNEHECRKRNTMVGIMNNSRTPEQMDSLKTVRYIK